MRHEKKVLEQKMELLTKSLEVFCKIKESLSCDRVIKVATENLRMRNCCRRVHQDLQVNLMNFFNLIWRAILQLIMFLTDIWFI